MWQALLAVPFVLHSQPAGIFDGEDDGVVIDMASHAHRRYAEIMYDVEQMITDHSWPPSLPVAPRPRALTSCCQSNFKAQRGSPS